MGVVPMNILVTGAKGFIGKNLIAQLKNKQYGAIYEFDLDTEPEVLDSYAKECDFIFHLAGVNRPEKQEEYMEGNYGFTDTLLYALKKYHNTCPILVSSSIQAALDNPYGLSKRAGEELLFSYAKETGSNVLIYRLANVFGKWCKPNYNSAVATFCYNIARDLPVQVNYSNKVMQYIYIDDLVEELIHALEGKEHQDGLYCNVPIVYTKTLGETVELIQAFHNSRKTLQLANMEDDFERKLYSTYLSYLPKDQFSYPLTMNIDQRGSFTEIIRTRERGQISVNISKPGITKGNHWHHSKTEKFLVVNGIGLIQLRRIDEDEVIEYRLSGDKLELIDIPPGYTHNLINVGDSDLITIIWANEVFQPDNPDTYYLLV